MSTNVIRAAVLLASALACTSAAIWSVPLDTMGLVKTDASGVMVWGNATAPPSADAPVDADAEKNCTDQIGKVENGVVMNTMPKYDVAKILEEHGGVPGKLNVTWNREVPEPPGAEDTRDEQYWMYDYRRSDFKTFVRTEHALLRHKDKEGESVDVHGDLYWTPPGFCGKMRHAKYRVNAEGFTADVTLEYCSLDDERLTCATPSYCHTNSTHQYCVG